MMRYFSLREIEKIKNSFSKARPFPHVIIEDFFMYHENLLRELKKEQFFKKDSDLFSFKQTNNLFHSKNKTVKSAVDTLSSKAFSDLIGEISSIKLKPGAADVSAALYEKNDYLLCHDDEVENRKIAFIIYLSESLSEKDGGALSFFDSKNFHPTKLVVAHFPLENSMMVFAVSKKSWHEVEEMLVSKSRYTIGGWLH